MLKTIGSHQQGRVLATFTLLLVQVHPNITVIYRRNGEARTCVQYARKQERPTVEDAQISFCPHRLEIAINKMLEVQNSEMQGPGPAEQPESNTLCGAESSRLT